MGLSSNMLFFFKGCALNKTGCGREAELNSDGVGSSSLLLLVDFYNWSAIFPVLPNSGIPKCSTSLVLEGFLWHFELLQEGGSWEGCVLQMNALVSSDAVVDPTCGLVCHDAIKKTSFPQSTEQIWYLKKITFLLGFWKLRYFPCMTFLAANGGLQGK